MKDVKTIMPARWVVLVRGLLLALCLSSQLALAQANVPTESQLKAAFLYKFGNFVEWPSNTLSSSQAPLVIGIFGSDAFKADLERVVQNKSINGHPLVVRRITSTSEVTNCHILFVTGDADGQLKDILEAVKGTNILTVGETSRFITEGGMINFVLEDSKIRFQINSTAAEHAGLRISSKLLALAKPLPK